MVQSSTIEHLAWIPFSLLEAILLFYLFKRKFHRIHPAFCTYITAVLCQGLLGAFATSYWGERSRQEWLVYWTAQIVVISARWLAIMEIARKVFAEYRGIQRVVKHMIIAAGACVIAYSFAFSQYHWTGMVLNADRAIELFIATFLVCMFAFARYYRLPVLNLERQLAIGFCLYSCTWVINDSIFENKPGAMWDFYYYVNVLAYLASLLLWIGAVRAPVEARSLRAEMQLSPEMYGQLSEQLNSRLNLLNHRLDHLFRSGDSQS
jgi:hypothetical protein